MGLIRGRYEPVAVVGKGGQGEVLKARDRLHDRLVAVKVRGDLADGRLLSETRTLLDLSPHPSLPVMREDFFEDDRYYMVMDWIDGRSLQDMLADTGELSLEETTRYLAPVATALDHLHGHKPPIVHCDVKPANILVTQTGDVFLVDLGIASVVTAMGTEGYMAPEIVSGTPPTPAADVFSLAATAFALMCGSPPRPGLRPRWKSIPDDRVASIEMTLARALAFDPSRRHGTAFSLIEALKAEDRVPGNLRLSLSPFIGREKELEEVRQLLAMERLVTIMGAGGLGKTRLAEQVASVSRDSFPDGAWMVGLADVGSQGLVAQTIAATLGADVSAEKVEVALANFLATKKLLLVIDNCEHLVEECADLISSILSVCPGVHVLATSRSPLGIEGEVHWRIPTMSYPTESTGPQDLFGYESVQLFIDRARRVKPGFKITTKVASEIASICAHLEGMPLAVELAAARVKMMTPGEISERLKDRDDLLSTTKRSSPRLSSIRAAIDWSYEMLGKDEAAAFAWLSVFSGGFTVDAAKALSPDPSQVLTHLQLLNDQSLISGEESDGVTRYRMLETIRAYASERLRESGSAAEARSRHLEWFCALAERLEEELGGPIQHEVLDALETEHDNLRAALAHSLDVGSVVGLRLAASLWRFWEVRGHLAEGRRWVESLLKASSDATPHLRARALRAAGGLALRQGDLPAASRLLSQGEDLARAADDMPLVGAIVTSRAVAAGSQGNFSEERRLYEEALSIWRQLGHKRGQAVVLGNLGTLSYEQGDFEGAGRYFEESLTLRRELGDTHGIAASLNGLGLVSAERGDRSIANHFYAQAIAHWDSLGYSKGVAIAKGNMASLALVAGNTDEARSLYEQSIESLRDLDVPSELADSLHGLGDVIRMEGNIDKATDLYRESLSLRHSIGDRRGIAESLEALAISSVATKPDDAALMLATAADLRNSIGSPPSETRRADIEKARAQLDRDALPDLEKAIAAAMPSIRR